MFVRVLQGILGFISVRAHAHTNTGRHTEERERDSLPPSNSLSPSLSLCHTLTKYESVIVTTLRSVPAAWIRIDRERERESGGRGGEVCVV